MRILILALFPALIGCPTPEAPPPGSLTNVQNVVLTASGHPVYQEVLDMAMQRVPADRLAQLKASGEYKQLVERLALGEVLYHRALDQGLHEKPEVAMQIAVASRDALAQAFIEDHARNAVSDDDVREAYEARKVQYASPSASLRLAIVPSAEAAAQVVQAVRGGSDLAEAVEAAGSPMPVQDLGWTPKGKLSPALDEVVFQAGADGTGVLDPIEMSGRHVVAEVTERRSSTPFEEVAEALRSELEGEAVEAFTQQLESEVTFEWKGDAPEAAEG